MGEARSSDFSNIHFVFLDRDGVLNRNLPGNGFVLRWEDFEFLPGVERAIAALNRSGRKVILATNQRCVALGLCSEAGLLQIHDALCAHLAVHGAHLDALYCCVHAEGECDCRKPAPGLFLRAFLDFPGATARNSVMIGDSLSDIEAGALLGMRTIFIAGERPGSSPEAVRAKALADASAASLKECVEQHLGSPV